MKNTLFALLITCTQIGFTSIATAQPTLAPVMNEVSVEVSAILTSSQYAKLIATQKEAAVRSGLELRMISYYVGIYSNITEARLVLVTKPSADFNGQWSDAGNIVANIEYGPMGEVTISSMYFEPSAAPPGGASVGNN